MANWGQRLGWQPLLCLYVDDNNLFFFPLKTLVRTDKGYRADTSKGARNLLPLVSP